jgi:hypothetical protein
LNKLKRYFECEAAFFNDISTLPGTPRRKKKIVHQTAATDDKKLQSTLKKLAVNNIPGIEEVNLIKNDGSVIHFNNPKTQASLASNVFAITGHGEQKQASRRPTNFPSNLNPETKICCCGGKDGKFSSNCGFVYKQHSGRYRFSPR